MNELRNSFVKIQWNIWLFFVKIQWKDEICNLQEPQIEQVKHQQYEENPFDNPCLLGDDCH